MRICQRRFSFFRNGLRPLTQENTIYSTEPITVVFNQESPNWSKDPDFNELFLRASKLYLVDLLRSHREHLFLNEALDQLGLPRKSVGQLVGWRYAPGKDICLWEQTELEGNTGFSLTFTHEGEIYKDIER